MRWVSEVRCAGEEPRVWRLTCGLLDVKVHRYLNLPGWYFSCHQLEIDCAKAKSAVLADAQAEALERVRTRARAFVKALSAEVTP
jgi:hypothetical protein